MEATGLGGATLGLVLLPGLLSAGIGTLVFVGLDALTGYGLASLGLPGTPHARVAMLALPMTSVLLATLLLFSDGLVVMPPVIVAVVVAHVSAAGADPWPSIFHGNRPQNRPPPARGRWRTTRQAGPDQAELGAGSTLRPGRAPPVRESSVTRGSVSAPTHDAARLHPRTEPPHQDGDCRPGSARWWVCWPGNRSGRGRGVGGGSVAAKKITHLSADERKAQGVDARGRTPCSSHQGWRPAGDRPDPVALLEEQNTTREPDLVPVRHGRMMVSPFTFYRGAAKIMAADLDGHPDGGAGRPVVRRCASVELRRVRLAGAEAAVRPERLRRDPAGAVRVRRETDGGQLHDRGAQQRVLQGRHARGDAGVGGGLPGGDGGVRADADDGHLVRPPRPRTTSWPRSAAWSPRPRRRAGRKKAKARQAGGEGGQEGAEDGGEDGGEGAHPRQPAGAVQARRGGRRAVSDRQPTADRRPGPRAGTRPTACPPRRSSKPLREQFRAYRATLQDDRRQLLERFEIVDMARKVVGVGSVGTRAFIVLLQGRDAAGPVVPAGQGGHRVGAGGSPAQEPLPAARRAGGAGAADDAGRQRHLPGLDARGGCATGTSTGGSCAT